MTRKKFCTTGALLLILVNGTLLLDDANADDSSPAFKIVFVSNREHYFYPHVYLYERDGNGEGRITGSIQPQDKRLDHQPVMSADGRSCIYGYEVEATVGRLQLWDLVEQRALDLPEVNQGNTAVFSPSLSADGKLLAYSGWARAGSSARWDVFLFDTVSRQPVELPGLNSLKFDERRAALSGDGRWLAYTTNANDGAGLTEVRLYDRNSGQVVPLLDVNSAATDSHPSVNGDGRLLCFASDREGGAGGLDIYLYDCVEQKFLDLPGLNSPGHEQSPSITGDGRLIAFVSERFDSPGEHDVFVYDRVAERLLSTPNLNTDRDDFDPCIIMLPSTAH